MPVGLSNAARARADLKLPLHSKPQTALVNKIAGLCQSAAVCHLLAGLL